MNCPKVRSVKAADNHILIVEFDNNEKMLYDVSPLLEKVVSEQFEYHDMV